MAIDMCPAGSNIIYDLHWSGDQLNHLTVHRHSGFLDALRTAKKDVLLVTNAHQDSLALKMEKTQLAHKFDRLITVHEFSLPKEDPGCWHEVHRRHPFNAETTLLIDDNLHALQSAREYGIRSLLAIYQPDSQGPRIETEQFDAIHSFAEIMPITEVSNEPI